MLQSRTARNLLGVPLAVGAGVSMLVSGGGPLIAHAAAHSVQAGIGTITEFTVPTASSTPNGITAGSDGNIWFTEYTSDKIGRITPSGTITEFNVPTANAAPRQIAAGPDGNLWFTEFSADQIGRITPSGTITEFPVPTLNSGPRGIVAGPDGDIWFTEFNAGNIAKLNPTTGVVTEYPIPTLNSGPRGIEPGPNGNLWFTENSSSKIGEITTSGVITEFTHGLTANSQPARIRTDPNGNLWFTENIGNNIGEITTGGTITEYPVTTLGAGPQDIVAGSNGNLWFTEQTGNQIGEIVPGPSKLVLALDSGFVPSTLTPAVAGTTVQWLFVGGETHGVTDSTKLKLFASGTQEPGTSFSFVYSGAGVFKYKDSVHAALSGTVSVPVTASPTSGPPSTPFTITFGTATAPTGFVFDLEVKAPGSGYALLENGTTTGSTTYTPTKAGKYQFKARLRKSGSTTLASPYSAVTSITVT